MTALAQCVSRECTGKVELFTLDGRLVERCRVCGYVGAPRPSEPMKPASAPKEAKRRANRRANDRLAARRRGDAPPPMSRQEAGRLGAIITNELRQKGKAAIDAKECGRVGGLISGQRRRLPPIDTRREA